MSRILVVNGNELERELIRAIASAEHDVVTSGDLSGAVRELKTEKPDLLITQMDGKTPDAVRLLTHMRDYGLAVPTIVVAGRNCQDLKAAARKLGAKAFVERPVTRAGLEQAIAAVLNSPAPAPADVPLLTREEKSSNITQLAERLNRQMKCGAGSRQVFIQSFITGRRAKTKPRVCLKCKVRAEFGMRPHVYYEHIRDICCGDPHQCEALRLLRRRNNMQMTI